ncbi:BTAD domain-containing putative transcriptional regulator [Kutzneria sp. 744]|uniref:AfsR/SARP family transcriptional regulator n=1 Tax=Kutzneria sp. (strain 744) TaxID=345341 RepID=UPI0004AFB9DC|nr:BTAD domain-containing putative transcriptional regulator [Kutzneria sp. 744]
MVVRLLGEVGALADGRPLPLGIPRQRCVLTALAVDAGRVVPVDLLVDRVWGPDATPRARATLHSYLSRLRRVLSALDGVTIDRRSGGYVLHAEVDLHRFRDLCAASTTADDEQAVALLTDALSLWQGQALTGLDGEWIEAERARLARERLTAQHDLADARLRLGHGGQLVVELAERAGAHPLDERVAGQYMLALHQIGRTADALEHYRQVRTRLIEELGTEPNGPLQELHGQVLTGTPPRTESLAPMQLRAAPKSFVGREEDLSRLDSGLDAARSDGTMMLTAVTGAGGLGKTWLALRWAHRHLDRFPDGQLFVDLRGFSPDNGPMPPSTALRGFLAALGVGAGAMPPDEHARSALFRSLTASRRMLVVLDNAANTEQITPLLPGGEACAVVVTSRNRLTGLVTAHDARRVPLEVLSEDEARGLLAVRLGPSRVHAERTAVDELIDRCGGLPLALSVIAGRAGLSLSAAASELRESGLDGLADDDPSASLPTVLSWSYEALTEEQAEAFGLLAIAPGPDISLLMAANLIGLPPGRAQRVLRGLEQASLLDQDSCGRYRMHDLIRAYGTQRASDTAPAQHRMLDHCAHTAHRAGLLLDAHRGPTGLAPPTPGPHVQELPDARAAMLWFNAERPTLLAAQHLAARLGRHHTVWWLAMSLDTFLQRRGHRHDRLAVWRSASSLPTPATLRHLGQACAAVGRHEEALSHLRQAIDLAADNPYELAHAHQTIARLLDDHQALRHTQKALHLLQRLDTPLCVAHGHNAIGWHTARLGDHDAARRHFHAALALHREHGNAAGVAISLDRLGTLEHEHGRHHAAIDHYRQALALRRHLGNSHEYASILDRLGPPHAALGQHDQARALWQEALRLYRRQGRDADAAQVQRRLDMAASE